MFVNEQTIDRELYVPGVVSKVRLVSDENGVSRLLLAAVTDCKEGGVYSWLIAEKTADSNGLIPSGHVSFGADVNVNDIALAAEDSIVAAALSDGRLALLRLIDSGALVDEERRRIDVFPAGEQIVCLLAISVRMVDRPSASDSNALCEVIVCGSCAGSLALYHLDSCAQRATVLTTQLTPVNCLVGVSPTVFLSGHASGQLHIWDACRLLRLTASRPNAAVPTFSKALAPLGDGVTSLAVHPDTYELAFGTSSGSIGIGDFQRLTHSNYEPAQALISMYPIVAIVFHPLCVKQLFVAAKDGIVHFDVTGGGSVVANREGHQRRNSRLISGGSEQMDCGGVEPAQMLANAKVTQIAPYASPFPSAMHAVGDRLAFGTTTHKLVVLEGVGDTTLSAAPSTAIAPVDQRPSRHHYTGLSYDDLLIAGTN